MGAMHDAKLKNIAQHTKNVYSVLTVKAFNEELREFTGIATTPDTDRIGDIVESDGAEFKLPIPLLWMHAHDLPVGQVIKARVTKSGIEVTCRIATVLKPAGLVARLDEAWESLKAGLVRGLSIGFSAVEYSFMDNGGIHFTKWNWHELSMVVIPAAQDAGVTAIKSLYEHAAASGIKALPVVKTLAGVSAKESKPIKQTPLEGTSMKTIAEQKAGFENTKAEKQKQMAAILEKSEGQTLDAAAAEDFDTLQAEIDAIDKHMERLATMEKTQATQLAKAKPIADESGMGRRLELGNAVAKATEKLEPGIAFSRYAMCLIHAKGDYDKAFKLGERHYPNTENVVKLLKAQSEGANIEQIMRTKATVAAGTTTDSTWAAPLVYANTTSLDFINWLRPRTLIGQANFRPIPFNVRIPRQTSGGASRWVGQGKSKPVTKFDFDAIFTAFTKVAGITVITEELARFSDPAAEALVRDQLGETVIERIDTDLFDPDVAAVANVNPAGLLNGVTPVAGPSGSDPEDIRCAILRLWAPWDISFMGARPAYYTTPGAARFLASMRDALGNRAFPGMTATGGELDGVPVRTSQYLANNGGSQGVPFILVDEAEIYLADDGNVTIAVSREATIEMSDTPVGSSSATVTSNGSPFVSMFQTDSMALRAERFIWWGARRSGAVQWIDGFPTSC